MSSPEHSINLEIHLEYLCNPFNGLLGPIFQTGGHPRGNSLPVVLKNSQKYGVFDLKD
jgi:hypothetical protein